MIEIANLTKVFCSGRACSAKISRVNSTTTIKAVDNVSLQIKKGEVFCLLGPNGAGKTTLLKMLATLILPTSGTAHLNGYDIIKDEIGVKSSIGFVGGDERSFYWRLTGRQNLEFYSAFYNIPSQQAKNKINELIEFLQIEHPDKSVGEYSTGMKQRLNIARALLHNPPILLMDEPTKSLDPLSAAHLRNFVTETLVHRKEKTVIFCTHNLSEAQKVADRIGIIYKGQIKICETFENLQKITGESDLEKIFASFTKEW